MTAGCHRFEHGAYCDATEAEAARFLESVATVEPATRVPTCPDWSVADLIDHLGTVHRWAGNMIAVLAPERIPSARMDLEQPDDYADRPVWFRAGAARLLDALRAGDPDAAMWGWGSDKHLRFWSRRMLHETTVHRADADITAGREPEIHAPVAVDGIDEFLDNLPHAAYWAPKVQELRGDGETIALRATDAGVTWGIRLEPAGFAWDHAAAEAGVTIDGSAPDLLLLLWGRMALDDASRFEIAGDRGLVDFWRERSAI